MSAFLDEDFLLGGECARRLYHEHAAGEPILDYHCHLPPAAVAANAKPEGLAQAWLGGDHYKWRAMRAAGVAEELVTGRSPDYLTFAAYAGTMPLLVGNPLYHWSHLELRRYFGVEEVLDGRSARGIYEACEALLAGPGFGARELLERMNVAAVCTTDDPADSLEHHAAYAAARPGLGPKAPLMFPAFRPDKALAVERGPAWRAYLERLGESAAIEIRSYGDLVRALDARHAAFHLLGCRLSDHALSRPVFEPGAEAAAPAAFASAFAGGTLSAKETEALKTALLLELGRMDARRGWTMQLHLAAERDLNSRAFGRLGPDTGYDAVGESVSPRRLGAFLDALDAEGLLPKTVLYSLNPNDYPVLASVMGCFQGGVPGKLQLGSAWWFNDHVDGIRAQLSALAGMGLLGRFIGMLTDSRSFLSFPRHEYFRRILCGLVGGWMERGEAPRDFESMGALVRALSFGNARDYLALPGL